MGSDSAFGEPFWKPMPTATAEPAKGAESVTPGAAAVMNAHSLAELHPAPPAGAEVREAAERVRSLPPSTNEFNVAVANLLTALRANASPAPGSAAVREAAEALTVYCDVCEADRREPCHTVTTGDPAPYPHPERAVAAALAARGGE